MTSPPPEYEPELEIALAARTIQRVVAVCAGCVIALVILAVAVATMLTGVEEGAAATWVVVVFGAGQLLSVTTTIIAVVYQRRLPGPASKDLSACAQVVEGLAAQLLRLQRLTAMVMPLVTVVAIVVIVVTGPGTMALVGVILAAIIAMQPIGVLHLVRDRLSRRQSRIQDPPTS